MSGSTSRSIRPAPGPHRVGFERPDGHDPYRAGRKLAEPTACPDCGAVHEAEVDVVIGERRDERPAEVARLVRARRRRRRAQEVAVALQQRRTVETRAGPQRVDEDRLLPFTCSGHPPSLPGEAGERQPFTAASPAVARPVAWRP